MRQLLSQLEGLNAALVHIMAASQKPGLAPSDIDAHVRAINRKAKFALLHLKILEGIKWRDVDNLGRSSDGIQPPEPLIVKLHEAELHLHLAGAVIDHAYIAFDGFIASVVNMTDTFSRLVNSVYSLGILERQASLFAVRDKCSINSALGAVLHDSCYTDWLRGVKELRGRCQHADVEDVLITQVSPLSCRPEPMVLGQYSWQKPQTDISLLGYAKGAMTAAENTLSASIVAVLSSPQNPTQ